MVQNQIGIASPWCSVFQSACYVYVDTVRGAHMENVDISEMILSIISGCNVLGGLNGCCGLLLCVCRGAGCSCLKISARRTQDGWNLLKFLNVLLFLLEVRVVYRIWSLLQ